ncbi:MAG: homoserine dehydrogenase [Candidatus Gastranaerophilales bacterium]|nr:homoserine dehydrogenase [Candidatus Gastranaerophilales bacterium]
MEQVVNIGLLGLGTVGGGVYKVLRNNPAVNIVKIAVKDKNEVQEIDGLDKNLLTEDAKVIVTNPDIDIIIEVIGGTGAAYEFIKMALERGKHVVTANKELIAKRGDELFEIAKQNNVLLLFEAAVGGGIPIIMPMKMSLAANKFEKIAGILNGTTNYILTKMDEDNADYEVVLKEAQELGYAEADPTGDVLGYDAAYKIAILASIAFKKKIDQSQIYREGIDTLSPIEFKYAEDFGYKIKLIALAQSVGNKLDVRVHPMLVSKTHPLAHINNVTNSVVMQAQPVNQVMFTGPGAGEMPTASSVCADVLSIVSEIHTTNFLLPEMRCNNTEKADILPIDETENKYFIRIDATDTPGVIGSIGNICSKFGINLNYIIQKDVTKDGMATIVILTGMCKEKDLITALNELSNLSSINTIHKLIRVMEL